MRVTLRCHPSQGALPKNSYNTITNVMENRQHLGGLSVVSATVDALLQVWGSKVACLGTGKGTIIIKSNVQHVGRNFVNDLMSSESASQPYNLHFRQRPCDRVSPQYRRPSTWSTFTGSTTRPQSGRSRSCARTAGSQAQTTMYYVVVTSLMNHV